MKRRGNAHSQPRRHWEAPDCGQVAPQLLIGRLPLSFTLSTSGLLTLYP